MWIGGAEPAYGEPADIFRGFSWIEQGVFILLYKNTVK